MHHDHELTPEDNGSTEEIQEDFVSSVAERPFMKALLRLKETNETVSDRLNELYMAGEARKDEYDTLVDDVVYDLLSDNEEFTINAKAMRSARPEDQKAIKDRQLEIYNQYRAELVTFAGLPEEASQDALEIAKTHVAEKIEDHYKHGGDQGGVLNALGIVTIDDKGLEHFEYPHGLFPASTDKKWNTYLDSVRHHVRTWRGVEAGTIDRREGEQSDEMRRLAHNAVTKDVDTILGFSELPDSRWNFAETRKLLAKMRDRKFPTVETAEKERTTHGLIEGLDVVRALRTRLADLHKK